MARRSTKRAWAGRHSFSALAAGGMLALAGGTAAAQSDSVTIVPGERYEAGALHRRLFGEEYRHLWTMPIRVPVLDLSAMHGGLRVIDVGGGQQTRSLQLIDPTGQEYRFRSVHKWPDRAREPDLDGSLAGRLLQDQVSSILPGAPVAAARIAIAAGFPHPLPNLYVLPDDPALGEYREEFAGMLGTLEEYPEEIEDGVPGFGDFEEIVGSGTLLENLDASTRHHVDARTFLAARMVDLILGDWDRHEDQWRWARADSAATIEWTPVPRDRDYAFSEFDGAMLTLARRVAPNTVRFSAGYRDLPGLLLNARSFDRRLLTELDRAAWDSVAVAVQASLTDAEIGAAVAALPREYVQAKGAELVAGLKARRDSLPAAAAGFYSALARLVEIRTTAEDEAAEIVREPGGDVDVTIRAPGGRRYFHRRFRPDETREIRIFLGDGDDHAVIRGRSVADGIRVRLIGGPGDDVLADSSSVSRMGWYASLHDHEGENVLSGGATTGVDRRAYQEAEAEADALLHDERPTSGTRLGISPLLGYSTTRGVILGGRLVSTRHAFRRDPFATRVQLDARFSTRWKDVGLGLTGQYRSPHPALDLAGEVVASRIDALRFYGFGNGTPDDLPSERYVVRRQILEGSAELGYRVGDAGRIHAGVTSYVTEPWLEAGSPLEAARPRGADRFSAFGFSAGLLAEEAGDSSRLNYRVDLGGSAYPVVSDGGSHYAEATGRAAVRVPVPLGAYTSLGARVGGHRAWGDYPYFAAAFLGGRQSLRGLPQWRYAGDSMVYAGVEASTFLGRLPFLMNWRVSPLVFFDVGRVFVAGDESSRWHSAPGFGASVAALGLTGRLTYAHGPEPRLYLETSAPF